MSRPPFERGTAVGCPDSVCVYSFKLQPLLLAVELAEHIAVVIAALMWSIEQLVQGHSITPGCRRSGRTRVGLRRRRDICVMTVC